MIRLRYFPPTRYSLVLPFKTRTGTGYAFHLGPFSLYLDTDRLP